MCVRACVRVCVCVFAWSASSGSVTASTPQPLLSASVEQGLGYAFLSALNVPLGGSATLSRQEVLDGMRNAVDTRLSAQRRARIASAFPSFDKLRNALSGTCAVFVS